MFQSTHPHGVRPSHLRRCTGRAKFQSTHPHGVRLGLSVDKDKNKKFQSTHPHGVRQGRLLCSCKGLRVSIHAPARGATEANYSDEILQEFQSTHPHGVRRAQPSLTKERTGCFNPRTRTGCDRLHCRQSARSLLFQSTHPHGVRPENWSLSAAKSTFQSTHPHGVRQTHH